MTVIQFLNYMSHSDWLPDDKYRPYYISQGRWQGMIKWYDIRVDEMQHMRTGECI